MDEQINQQVSRRGGLPILLTIIITALVVWSLTYYLMPKADGPADLPSSPEVSSPAASPSVATTTASGVTIERGFIKSAYKQGEDYFIDVDYIQGGCLGVKELIQDGKCKPGLTVEKAEAMLEGGGTLTTDECPGHYFGYGVGYCYYRNTNPQLRTHKISGARIIIPNHFYDFDSADKGIAGELITAREFTKRVNEGRLGISMADVFELQIVDWGVRHIIYQPSSRE